MVELCTQPFYRDPGGPVWQHDIPELLVTLATVLRVAMIPPPLPLLT